jgi:hypothetical protein
MAVYLIGIQFHEPESFALWKKGVIEDYESSTGIFIEAVSEEVAIGWGEKVAQTLLCRANSDESLVWKDFGYFCWVEKQEDSPWTHCFSFFQQIRTGEWPDFDQMGVDAYSRWASANGIIYDDS